MEIQLPTIRRGLPATHEIVQVLTAVCARCNLDPDLVTYKVIGEGDENEFTGGRGIKLKSLRPTDQWSIPVYLGTKSSSIRGQFSIKISGSNRSVPGPQLFQNISRTIGGHLYMITEEHVKSNGNGSVKKAEPQSVDKLASATGAAISDESSTIVKEAVDKVLETTRSTSPAADFGRVPTGNAAANAPIKGSYIRFFTDKEKIHTGTIALLAENPVGRPFGFDVFTRVLDRDLGIKCPPRHMITMVQVFTNRGYMERINKPPASARYVMTDEGAKFAALSLKEVLGLKDEVSESIPSVASPKPQLQSKVESEGSDLAAQLIHLKQREDEFQRLFTQREKAEEELEKLEPKKIQSQVDSLTGLVVSTERRLNELKADLESAKKLLGRPHDLQASITSLTEKINEPSLVADHKKYAQLVLLFK